MQESNQDLEQTNGSKTLKKIIAGIWITTLSAIVGVITLFISLSFSNLPSVEQLENPKSEIATQIFAIDGSVLGRYYTENRVPISFNELSPHLVRALVATEDERYFKHSGIDFKATIRVIFKTILMGDASSGGGSTITQQLAKQLFTGIPGSGLQRGIQKFKEWIIAVRLERKYTKEEIIAMYLNKVDFLYQGYGIKAAAETYFSKNQKDLELKEAAILIGMLKNPNLFNPLRRPEISKDRRNVVFQQMLRNQLLTPLQADSLSALPLELNFKTLTHLDGLATYYRMELAKEVKEILRQPSNLKSDGTSYDIYRDGLKIYTTLDPALQAVAEEEMVRHMQFIQDQLTQEWRGLDPWTYEDKNSTTEVPVEVRQQSLDRLIRESERYQLLRKKYLLESIEAIEKEIPAMNFFDDDRDVIRLIKGANDKNHFRELVQSNIIPDSRATVYQSVLKSKHFSQLQQQWKLFQKELKKVFAQKTSMTVFAYNSEGQKDTILSPLDSIKYMRMFLQTGIMVMDPKTGYIKAWVGGINHDYFKFDHVKSSRQVGSTFKPFVYATAIAQQGFSPCYQVYDIPQTIAPGDGNFGLLESWTPDNFEGKFTGELLTLKDGLRQSKNTVSVHLMKQLGDTEPVRSLVNNMGIDSSARHGSGRLRVPKTPSICLGVTDLTVMEMTGAYSAFANNGTYTKPVHLLKIEDKNGKLIYQSIPEETQALPPNANYAMVEMLRYAATGMTDLESDYGGKTGTTNDFADGWYMGITPDLVVGTWVGGEDRWIHFRSPLLGQGSRMARPFFHNFIRRLEGTPELGYDKSLRFSIPEGDLGIVIDCEEYNLFNAPNMENIPFEDNLFEEGLFGDEKLIKRQLDTNSTIYNQ